MRPIATKVFKKICLTIKVTAFHHLNNDEHLNNELTSHRAGTATTASSTFWSSLI